MSNSEFASKQIKQIQHRIADAANKAGRNSNEITLVGASKLQNAELVETFYREGLADVGENYLKEALEKQAAIKQQALNWHFIGRIQSNKTKKIAANFKWVHSVASLSVAQRLARQNPNSEALNILLQINIDQEESKSGISPSLTPDLCLQASQLPNLHLRGFMVLPKSSISFEQQRKPFAATRVLLEKCNQRHGLTMDTLSMGMSADLEAAIAEGSTMLRIGSDLFGPRLAQRS